MLFHNYIIYSLVGETLEIKESIKLPERRNCSRCGFVSSQEICKACIMLEGLNRGLPKLGIGKSTKVKKVIDSVANNKSENNDKIKLKSLEF